MDLNKKIAFQCNMEDIEDIDNQDDETSRDVDCETFWETVELQILLHGFPNRKVKRFLIRPSFKNWSPSWLKKRENQTF